MWPSVALNRENFDFWRKMCPSGTNTLYKIRRRGGSQILPLRIKMGLYTPSEVTKMLFLVKNLSLRENPGGPQRNLNIGAQLEVFLYARCYNLTVFPTCADKRDIWHAGADLRSAPPWSGPSVCSPVANFMFIGAMRRPYGAKMPVLHHWVNALPAGMLRVADNRPNNHSIGKLQ